MTESCKVDLGGDEKSLDRLFVLFFQRLCVYIYPPSVYYSIGIINERLHEGTLPLEKSDFFLCGGSPLPEALSGLSEVCETGTSQFGVSVGES